LSLCFIKHHAKGMYGDGGIAPHTLIFALDVGEWSVSCPCRLTPGGKCPRYPLERKLDRPQNRSGRGDEMKKSLPYLCRQSNFGRPARSLVTILTELPRVLMYEGGLKEIIVWIIITYFNVNTTKGQTLLLFYFSTF